MPEYITLSQAARLTPGRVSPSSVWRWARYGVKARSGVRVRLSHVRQGSRLFTTQEALEEFLRALTAEDLRELRKTPVEAPLPPKPSDRQRRANEIRAAERSVNRSIQG